MAKDTAVGGAIFGCSVVGIVIYGLLLVYAWQITIRVTAFLAVALLLGILAWIGYTMATTPPPEPIADIQSMTPDKPTAPAEPKKDQPAPS